MIIAVLGFIAPTVTLLLPILGGRINLIRSSILEQERNSENIRRSILEEYKLVVSSVSDVKLGKSLSDAAEQYSKSATKTFDRDISVLKRKLRRLDLKMQIKHIFISLILSLFFIAWYYFFKVKPCGSLGCYKPTLQLYRCSSLILSGISFTYAIWRLWTLICVVVEHRTEYDDTSITRDGITPTKNDTRENKTTK